MSTQTYQGKFDTFFDQLIEKLGNTRGLETIDKQDARALNKKLSQLIAKSWLPNDPDGVEFRKIILRGDSEEIKNWLKNHGVDLEGFFGISINIEVNWDTFFGIIKETTTLGTISNRADTYILPYPPRPVEVKDEHLERWVNDQNPDNAFPLDPYIPLTGL